MSFLKIIKKEQIYRCRNRDLTLQETADELKVSLSVIRHRCKLWNISFKEPSKFDLDLYLRLRESNFKEKEIAEILGIKGCQLNNKKREFGITDRLTLKNDNFKNTPHLKEIEEMLKKGLSSKAIVSFFNKPVITEYFINKHFEKYQNFKKHHHGFSIFSKEFAEDKLIPKDYVLTGIQKEIVYGSLFGDNYCDKKGYLSMGHSVLQLDYIKLKHHLLSPISLGSRFKDKLPCPAIYFATACYKELKEIHTLFYSKNGKKDIFNKKIWPYLTPLSLAIWYLDDGCKKRFTLSKDKKEYSYSNIPDFIEYIQNNLGIYLEYNSNKYDANFKILEEPKEFIKLLNNYATPDLKYKLGDWFSEEDFGLAYKYLLKEGWLEKRKKCLDIVKDNCKYFIITPFDYRSLDNSDKKDMLDTLVNFYRKKGFPYPENKENNKMTSLFNFKVNGFCQVKSDLSILSGHSGNALCSYYFPNLYHSKRKIGKSPFDVFNSDKLKDIIEHILETYNKGFTPDSLLTKLKINSNPVYNFKPAIARYLFSTYGGSGGVVYDYSTGFGGRALGSFYSGIKKYVGVDLNRESYLNLKLFTEDLKRLDPTVNISFELHNCGSENFIPKEPIDFAFSSPPYYDLEEYSPEIKRSISAFDGFYSWVEDYFKKTLFNIDKSLKLGGYFGINISPYLKKDVVSLITKELGYSLYREYSLRFSSKYKKEYKEPIFIFQKI